MAGKEIPWRIHGDERYIYLHEKPYKSAKCRSKYTWTIHPLGMFVDPDFSIVVFLCFFVPWFFSMACWWTWTFKYRVAIAADPVGWNFGTFFWPEAKQQVEALESLRNWLDFWWTWAEYLPLKCRYVMFFLGGFCVMFWTDSKEFSENFSLVYVWIYSLPRMQSSPPGCHYILSRESLLNL